MQLQFTDLALEDLASIEKYTRDKWGEQQADAYIDLLEQTISNILDNPKIGPERPDIAENCRYLPEESHLIFYRIDDDKIVVLAIPHGSMDIKRYLEREEEKEAPVSRDFDPGR